MLSALRIEAAWSTRQAAAVTCRHGKPTGQCGLCTVASTPPAQLNPSTLTPFQRAGWACARCGCTQTTEIRMVPVGMLDGIQLFACSPTCSAPEEEQVDDDALIRHGH
ncbi:hypothetical protein FHR32_005163 [Streptosporangium album]|uniref:Uncharacterized protein n=1 Tax=Streptosporangium album TaxID=47479 RepID=A0A7W7WB76_9ACTN|nr:hypothetical protein [Streptosporangium album]MBB4940786.1 hypothetical protein [Streptosporangium album]